MLDREITTEERIQKVDHFTRQLVNSGYSWSQCREIIVSALKGILKKEIRERESGAERYRTGEESLEDRLKKHLTEATEWYKKGGRDEEEQAESVWGVCGLSLGGLRELQALSGQTQVRREEHHQAEVSEEEMFEAEGREEVQRKKRKSHP